MSWRAFRTVLSGPTITLTFSSGLKPITIMLSILEAILLEFSSRGLAVIAWVVNDLGGDFDGFGFGLAGLFGTAFAVLFEVRVVSVLPLGFQLVGRLERRRACGVCQRHARRRDHDVGRDRSVNSRR